MEQPRGQSSLGSGEKHKGGALAGTPAAAEGLDLRFPLRRGFRSMYEGGGGAGQSGRRERGQVVK